MSVQATARRHLFLQKSQRQIKTSCAKLNSEGRLVQQRDEILFHDNSKATYQLCDLVQIFIVLMFEKLGKLSNTLVIALQIDARNKDRH